MSSKAWVVGAAVVVLGYAVVSTGAETVSGTEAHALVKSGATLLDVRTREEFADGHIEGAINIPVNELGARLGELGSREKPVVVYCFSGGRSRGAARTLRDAGFTQVKDLGAMRRWETK